MCKINIILFLYLIVVAVYSVVFCVWKLVCHIEKGQELRFECRMQRRDVTAEWRSLCHDERNDFYCLRSLRCGHNIIHE